MRKCFDNFWNGYSGPRSSSLSSIEKVPLRYWLRQGRKRFFDNPANELTKLHQRYGSLIDLNIPFGPTRLVTNDPELAKQVLVVDHRNYVKDANTKILRLALGNGLLTNEGEAWREQRRIIQPAFRHQAITHMLAIMAELSEQWLHGMIGQNRPFDVYAGMIELTSQIAARTLLDSDAGDVRPLVDAMNTINRFLSERMFQPCFKTQLFVPTPSVKAFKVAYSYVADLIKSIVAQRMKNDLDRQDLLGLLLANSLSERGEFMDSQQLVDECVTLFIAGHETTANALSWTLYLLAKHPEAMSKAGSEADEAVRQGGSVIGAVPSLGYIGQVIQEALRLYPPAWIIGRESIQDGYLGNHAVKQSAQVLICTYALHRNPAYWPDPETFDPHRFDPERTKQRHSHAHLPFGSGARTCIGKHFAMLEMQIVLATMLRHGGLKLADEQPVRPHALVTLKPSAPIRMQWC